MRTLEIKKQINLNAETAYKILSDFSAFEKHCPSVIKVGVNKLSPNESLSDWRVNFREGIMVWQESDTFDKENLTILFEQTEGDAEEFRGTWQVTRINDVQCNVTFSSEFSLGIPSLSEVLEPIAEEAIHDNIMEMLGYMLESKGSSHNDIA